MNERWAGAGDERFDLFIRAMGVLAHNKHILVWLLPSCFQWTEDRWPDDGVSISSQSNSISQHSRKKSWVSVLKKCNIKKYVEMKRKFVTKKKKQESKSQCRCSIYKKSAVNCSFFQFKMKPRKNQLWKKLALLNALQILYS